MEMGLVFPAPPTGRRAAGNRLFDAMVSNGNKSILRLVYRMFVCFDLHVSLLPLSEDPEE